MGESEKTRCIKMAKYEGTSRRKKNWFGLRLAFCTVTNLGVCVAAIVRMLGVLALVRLVWFGVSLVSRALAGLAGVPPPSPGGIIRDLSPHFSC